MSFHSAVGEFTKAMSAFPPPVPPPGDTTGDTIGVTAEVEMEVEDGDSETSCCIGAYGEAPFILRANAKATLYLHRTALSKCWLAWKHTIGTASGPDTIPVQGNLGGGSPSLVVVETDCSMDILPVLGTGSMDTNLVGGVYSSMCRPTHPVSHVEANPCDYIFCLSSDDIEERPVVRMSTGDSDICDLEALECALSDHEHVNSALDQSQVADTCLGAYVGCKFYPDLSVVNMGVQCDDVFVSNECEWKAVQDIQLAHFQEMMERNNEQMGDKLLAQFEKKLDLLNARHAEDLAKVEMLHKLEVDSLKVQIAGLSAPRCAIRKVKVCESMNTYHG